MNSLSVSVGFIIVSIIEDRQNFPKPTNQTKPACTWWPQRLEVLHVCCLKVWQSFEGPSFYSIGSTADHFNRHSVCWFNWIWKSWFCPPALGNVLLPAHSLEETSCWSWSRFLFFPVVAVWMWHFFLLAEFISYLDGEKSYCNPVIQGLT